MNLADYNMEKIVPQPTFSVLAEYYARVDPVVENPKENAIRLLKFSRDEAIQMIAEGTDEYAEAQLKRHILAMNDQIYVYETGNLPERRKEKQKK
jgi:hypothetical protein